MFTRTIRSQMLLGKSGVRWDDFPSMSFPTWSIEWSSETPEQQLIQALEKIKADTTKNDAQKDATYAQTISQAYPNDLKTQLEFIEKNKWAGQTLPGEAVDVRFTLVEQAKRGTNEQRTQALAEIDKILKLDENNPKAKALKTTLEAAKTQYETGVDVVKKTTQNQLNNLNREQYFAEQFVSWTGLLSMIRKEQWTTNPKTPKEALDALMKKFDQRGRDASRGDVNDDQLLKDLQDAGYLRFGGNEGSLEYGHKVVAALREIQNEKEWKKYERVISGTEALEADKYKVPDVKSFATWSNQQMANYLADVSGDGILSQTNQVSRTGFLGIFGREDMNKRPLSELGTAKLLQEVLSSGGDLWTKLGVKAPTKPEEMESARRALYLRVALAGGNPDAIRDPSLVEKVSTAQIQEQARALDKNNTARLESVKKALAEKNKELPPALLDQAGKSFLTAVDVGGLLLGTGVSLEELARNTKIDGENPKAITLLTAGKKWEKSISERLQAHIGAGAGAGVDTNGGVFAGVGVDGGIKFIMQDNGKMTVNKGNQTLELNVGVGTSLLGFVPVGTVELAYRWNDVISALQSSDAKTRDFLKWLFQTDANGNITMVDLKGKDDAMKALAGEDAYGVQDIRMACEYAKVQLASNSPLSSTEKVIAVQNFIENFARYNEIRNYQSKQGFHLSGIGFGILAGPAVLAPFVRLIGQNIQAGYRPDTEKTTKLAETKSQITLSADQIAQAPESSDLLRKRGATITADGRGIDVSKARFADIQIIGDTNKIIPYIEQNTTKVTQYRPKNENERIVAIVQTTRDMNGAETYILMLTTVRATTNTESLSKEESSTEMLNNDERKVLKSLVGIGTLPDTLPWDKQTFRQKYSVMESANDTKNGNYTTDLSELQSTVRAMGKDKQLMQILSKNGIDMTSVSKNQVFLRAFLGTLLALTSGGTVANKLGLRIGTQKNPTTVEEVNKYLDTKGLIEAELQAIASEYGETDLDKDKLEKLMKFSENEKISANNIPPNMYAESAYAKYGQNGTAVLPPWARIAGNMVPYQNDVIRNALIARQQVPENLSDKGFGQEDYTTLLKTGEVTMGGIKYTAEASKLNFARSAVTDKKTCFNAVFAITVPIEVRWTQNTAKPVSAGSLGIATDTILSGVTRANEVSIGFVGKNQHRSDASQGPHSNTEGGDKEPGTPAPKPAPATPDN